MTISIITATYNSARTIQRCLESLHSQTYKQVEHILIDGVSKDSTIEIVREHSPKSIILSEPDKGLYDALNKGIALASGDFIGFLHSDDIFTNETVLEDIVRSFEDSQADGIYGDLEYYTPKGAKQRTWSAGTFYPDLLKMGWMPPHPTLVLKRKVYEAIGQFNTEYFISADYEFILRLLSNEDIKIQYLPKSLVQMTTGGLSNRGIMNIIQKSREDYKAMKKHGFALPFSVLLRKNFSKIPQFFKK